MHSLKQFAKRKFYQTVVNIEAKQFIFILGHMRTGSTLLLHILNSHPEIAGYGETHTYYTSSEHLSKLILRTKWNLKRFSIPERYLLEKSLHDHISPSFEFTPNIRVIFLLRSPQDAINSILKMYDKVGHEKFGDADWSLKGTAKYYSNRMEQLSSYSDRIGSSHQITFTFDQFLSNPENSLSQLQNFLDLSTPLSESYQTNTLTGAPIVGDYSDNIFSGKIIRSRKSSSKVIDQEILGSCHSAFVETLAKLKANSLFSIQDFS